jgi:hypothetical protein
MNRAVHKHARKRARIQQVMPARAKRKRTRGSGIAMYNRGQPGMPARTCELGCRKKKRNYELTEKSVIIPSTAMNDDELRAMLIEYMGRGFLENIIALMKQDPTTVRFIPDLIGDETIMVRLGATALVEALVKEHRQVLGGTVPGLVKLLGHGNPTIRGDAANVLGIIGDRSALEALRNLRDDEHPTVREIVRDILQEIARGTH